MSEPSDAEALAVVERALSEVLADLESAQAELAVIAVRLAAAEGRVAALLSQEQAAANTLTMPVSAGGYRFIDETHATLAPGSPADQLARAKAAHAAAAAEAQAAGAVVARLQIRRDRLRRAQRTLQERLGAGNENSLRSEPRSQL